MADRTHRSAREQPNPASRTEQHAAAENHAEPAEKCPMGTRVFLCQRPYERADVQQRKHESGRPSHVPQNMVAQGFFVVRHGFELIEVQVHDDGHRRDRPKKGEGIREHVSGNESGDEGGITEFRRGIGVSRGTEDAVFRAAHAFTGSREACGNDSKASFVDS